MRDIIVRCDHAVPPLRSRDSQANVLEINQYAPNWNLRLGIANVSHKLLADLNTLARDLLDIAAFVYYADQSVARGTEKDVFNEDWARHFNFVIPVRNQQVWQRKAVVSNLIELLTYLTEDDYCFTFVERQARPEQLTLKEFSKALPFHPDADCVMLFSGGMDSLAGAIDLYVSNRKPVLTSHQSRSVLASLQRNLAAEIRKGCPNWSFPHLEVTINRRGSIATENTQRSRSFVFLAFGSLVAHEIGLNEVVVCENGVTTFNLPRLGQTTGTLASRSTHPLVIDLFRKLASEVFNVDLKITTPFLWKTRAEIIEILKTNSVSHLIRLSSSCNHSRRPKIYPHCGVCSQCIDRRFAEVYTGIEASEKEVMGYEKDIFTDDLNDGLEKMQPFSAVQFALDLRRRDIDSFCEAYPQVYDGVESLPGHSEEILELIYNLHQRYASEIITVMSKKDGDYWEKRVSGELPNGSLLMLVGASSPRLIDRRIAVRVNEIIDRVHNCPVGDSKPYEDIIKEALTFLFCENLPPAGALKTPDSQAESDRGYERRDLVFENRATEGFWADAKRDYDALGIIADAKNYKDEIDSAVVLDFSAKYLNELGLGRFGILVARQVPDETRSTVSMKNRVPSAIEAQKNEWIKAPHKMIILLDDRDIEEMLNKKMADEDPTDLIRDRVFILKSRI